jgi:predicted nucleic acid-binding protein
MTIVSNTTPLCYLTLIGHAEILPRLYGRVHVTQKVLEELCHPAAPASVRHSSFCCIIDGCPLQQGG